MNVKQMDSSTNGPITAQPSLTSLHNSNLGKVSNKWTSYLTYYDNLFFSVKDAPVSLLEIGVQNGGSLETWSKYFKNAKVVLGCDIDERCGRLSFEDSRIHVIVGNVNSDTVYREVVASGPFDVIIDDGSHLSEDILIGFLNYFPMVKPGGIYVIEDTHAIYQRESTNINKKNTAFGFFKDLTDVLNYQFWFNDQDIESLFRPYLNTSIPTWLGEGWVESIEFRNSIITIKKSLNADHNKLGQMIITGNVADVDAEPLRVKNLFARQTPQ